MIACETWSKEIYKDTRLQVKDILEWNLIVKIKRDQKELGGKFFEYL